MVDRLRLRHLLVVPVRGIGDTRPVRRRDGHWPGYGAANLFLLAVGKTQCPRSLMTQGYGMAASMVIGATVTGQFVSRDE